MTSHYMRCVARSSFENVFETLSNAFGNIYSKRFSEAHGPLTGIILGEEYYFRVNSDVAVLIILKEHSTGKTEIEIMSCAGGTGLVGVSYSAHSDYVHEVKNFLENSGFEVGVVEEIPYFGRKPS